MTARQHSAHVYKSLKAATRRLVKEAGGVESAASVTRVGKSNLSDYGASQNPITFGPIDVIADLESDTGAAYVTRALAQLAGCVLLPVEVRAGDLDWARRLAAIGKEASDVFARVQEAIATNGDIDAVEAVDIITEVDEALAAFADLRAALETRIENGDTLK